MTAGELGGVVLQPAERVGARFRIGFVVVSLGTMTALLTPLQFLLPLQSSLLSGEGRATTLAVVSTIGGFAAIVTTPLVGMASDRTRSRWGRRRPWAAASALIAAAGLAVSGAAAGIGTLVLGFSLLQIGIAGLVASSLAMVADQVPTAKRGTVTGLVGIAAALGPVLGSWMVSAAGGAVLESYLAIAVLLVGTTLVMTVLIEEPSTRRGAVPAWDWREWTGCMWVDPRRHPDVGWAWVTRFLVFLGTALSLGFVLYWAQEVLGVGDGDAAELATRMAEMTTYYAAAMVIASVLAGVLSDRLGFRKAFIVYAALALAALSVVNLVWATWTGILVTGVLAGTAFGIYSTIDLAVATDVLPDDSDRARVLGVLQGANSFPSLAGPALGAVILNVGGGFTGLFIASAVFLAAAAFTVTRIRVIR
ncbi:MFS transporter [Actinomycetes bacterium KLBMP 9759]